MTKVEITYHMHRSSDSGESLIILPMTEEHADDVILLQEQSRLLGDARHKGMLATLLDRLARLQGYSYGEFVDARAHYDKTKEV